MFIDQIGGAGKVSRVQQFATGTGNVADVKQLGETGSSFIEQDGSTNRAELLQDWGTQLNASTITQGGSGNMAEVFQTSSDNTSFVTQSGSGGMVTVTQGPPPIP